MATPSIFLAFFLLSHLSPHSANKEESHNNPNCHAFGCKEIDEIRYPFSNFSSPECGVYKINCDEPIPKIQVEEGGIWHVVKNVSYEEKQIIIQDAELIDHLDPHVCTYLYNDFMIQSSKSKFFELVSANITFSKCKRRPNHQGIPQDHIKELFKNTSCGGYDLYYPPPNSSWPPTSMHECSAIEFPMAKLPTALDPHRSRDGLFFLRDHGFAFRWGLHSDYENRNDPPPLPSASTSTSGGSNNSKKKKIIVGASIGVGVVFLFLGFLIFFVFPKAISLGNPIFLWKKNVKDAHNLEAFLKNNGSFGPRRYQYSDLKKITNCFKDKLGQGGCGSVFKGKLFDDRLVAVKVLDQSKGSGEEFINEVASIGRTYHVNVVTLLGFCSDGSKRALIYEFMPNGSLERFIYTKKPRRTNPLGWQKICEIALGIARGLEYLHRGCSTRILHFDIKPHNILLDQDFCPKIADFGLAKLCPMKDSVVSMFGTRGTFGYIAPEVYCRNFGGVSSKSDVYSYGMMVLEMVGGRRNIDVEVENTSEIYFPQWIYKRLDPLGDLGLEEIETEAEEGIARKMILVGLWCIQTDPRNRPSMGRVVEMLEGNLESLPMPPTPFLSSPTRPN